MFRSIGKGDDLRTRDDGRRHALVIRARPDLRWCSDVNLTAALALAAEDVVLVPYAEAQLVFDQIAIAAPAAMARYADAYEQTLKPEIARSPYRGLYPEREMWRHFRAAKLRPYTMRGFRSVLVRTRPTGGTFEEDAYVKLRLDHPALAAVTMPERADGACGA